MHDEVWDALTTITDRVVTIQPVNMEESNTLCFALNDGPSAEFTSLKKMTVVGIRIKTFSDGTSAYTLIERSENEQSTEVPGVGFRT